MPTENRITLTPDTPVRYLKGVGPKTAERFEKLGIVTLADLLCHYPRKYIDFTKPYSIAEAPADTECVVKAEVFAKPGGRILPGGRRMERVTAGDDVSGLEITWFNNPYAAQKLEIGQEYYFQGIVTGGMLRRQMVNPLVRTAEQVQAAAKQRGINVWRVDADHISVSCDEATTAGSFARTALDSNA